MPEGESLRRTRLRSPVATQIWTLNSGEFKRTGDAIPPSPAGTKGDFDENLAALATDKGSAWNENFNDLWTGTEGHLPSDPAIDSAVENTIIPVEDYFGLLRDHRLLYNLVRGNSIRFIAKVGQEEAIIEPKDITWSVHQFKYVRRIPKEDGTGFVPLAYYRYSIRADAKTRSFTVPLPDADIESATAKIEVPITVEAEWANPEEGISLADARLFFTDPAPLSIPTNAGVGGSDEQESFQERANYFSGILQYAAGSSLGEIVSQGLFGGGTNTSLFAGAMISKNDVSQMAGVNFELNPTANTRAGMLLGFDLSNSNTLFVGPSISSGAVQLGVGARVSSGDQSTKVKTRLAGALSFDLSRTLGKREKKVALAVDSTKTGGDWGQASDEQFKGLGLADLTLDMSAVPVGIYQVRLTRDQELDAAAPPVPVEKQDTYYLSGAKSVGASVVIKRMFLTTGRYTVQVLTPGFKFGGTQKPRIIAKEYYPVTIKIVVDTPAAAQP